jgi:hypothetical protein
MRNRTLIFAACVLMCLVNATMKQAWAAPSVPTNNIVVTVKPQGTYAEITVDLSQGAVALLQVGVSPPLADSGFHPKSENIPILFKKGDTRFTRALTERNEAGGFATHHQVKTLLPNGSGPLEQDKTYWYAVQVVEKEGKTIKTGSFKTKFRMAEIYITEIHVTNDSDSSGSGELSFHFFLGKSLAFKVPKDAASYNNLSSGQSVKFGGNFKLAPKNTAISDSVMLWIVGFDDDESCPFGLCVCGTGKGGITDFSPFEQSGENKCGEWTTVGKKINFKDPTATGLKENFLKQLFIDAIDGNGSELKYEVYVTVKVFYL